MIKNYLDYYFNKNNYFISNLRSNNFSIFKIIHLKKKYIFLDGNLKFNVYLPKNIFKKHEFYYNFNICDNLILYIKNIENKNSDNIILSNNEIKNFIILNSFKDKLSLKIKLLGFIYKRIKGGYWIISSGVICFLPYSFMDKKLLNNYNFYLNKFIYFRIKKLNLKRKNVILSRKLFVNNSHINFKKIFFNKVKIGNFIRGVIKKINNYFVIVSFGFIDSIILSKNSNSFNKKFPNESLKINKSVLCKIINIDYSKNRVFLSSKKILLKTSYKFGLKKIVRIYKINKEKIYVILKNNVLGIIKKKNKKYNNIIKVNNYIKTVILFFNKNKNIFILKTI